MSVRFTWLRPGGWGRLGVVVAVGILFATPMLWAVGAFGEGDDAIRRALIFLFAGMWFGVGVGYSIGWALHGFILRSRDHDDDEESGGHPARPAAAPPRPAAHPPGRPGH